MQILIIEDETILANSIKKLLTKHGFDVEDRIRGLNSGADYYLTKPFDQRELLACINAMLCIIFGLIMSFTRSNLERQSIQMMQELAANPWHAFVPNEPHSQIRLPYILMQIDDQGEVLAAGGSYFDLSDRQFLKQLLESSTNANMRTGLVPRSDVVDLMEAVNSIVLN